MAQLEQKSSGGGSAAPSSADIPSKGFELKPGSNGRSSGPALPINVQPGTGLSPEAQGSDSE